MSEILKVIKGAKSPLSWLLSGRGPVDRTLATARAQVCTTCPMNGKGPLTDWFSIPAAELIRMAIEARHDYKMETPHDAALGVCEACYCPMKTKVHEPIDLIVSEMPQADKEALWKSCWIPRDQLGIKP